MIELFITPDDDLQAILLNISQPTTIYLADGVYHGKLLIAANDVRLVGKSRETTIISHSDYARKPHPDGGEYNTFRTYTVCVTGERVTLENLTVENANDDPKTQGQCVALSVNAQTFHAKNVALRSMQDTLFTAPFPDDLVVRYSGLTDDPAYYDGFIPRGQLYMEGGSFHWFENCEICGTVDFVFGGAEALFENCRLVSLHDKRGIGFVAAPSHCLRQKYGYLFYNCKFINGGAAAGGVYLARPWRDFGRCDFISCSLGDHISPLLFDKWNDTYRNRTARFGYYGLSAEKLAPAAWSKEHTAAQADEIINYFTAQKKAHFGE